MVGADPKFQTYDRARPGGITGRARRMRHGSAAPHRLCSVALDRHGCRVLVPLSFVLAQCGKAPNAGMLAANSQASRGDTFDDRFPQPQFKDRFPTASESFRSEPPAAAAPRRRARSGAIERPTGWRRWRRKRPYPASDAQRRPDHAGQPEILGVSLSRQQSAHRRAVPECLQGRPPRPSRHGRHGSTGRTRPSTTTAS